VSAGEYCTVVVLLEIENRDSRYDRRIKITPGEAAVGGAENSGVGACDHSVAGRIEPVND
jgi:hypothetical protein